MFACRHYQYLQLQMAPPAFSTGNRRSRHTCLKVASLILCFCFMAALGQEHTAGTSEAKAVPVRDNMECDPSAFLYR